jgi:hypothetical protein
MTGKNAIRFNEDTAARVREIIHSRVVVSENGCWHWQGRWKAGYGSFELDTVRYYAHRASYAAFNGPLEIGELVRHECDDTLCCNPAHLLKGDDKDNTADAISRGRHQSQHQKVKLKEEQVVFIREKLVKRHPEFGGAALARKFDVDQSLVHRVAKGRARMAVGG